MGIFTAILSTTVLPRDGIYQVTTLEGTGRQQALGVVAGTPHYIGHPATKSIVEGLGAVPAASNLFTGQEVGERTLALPIRQGVSTRKDEGFSSPHQAVGIESLDVREIKRLRGVMVGIHAPGCPSGLRREEVPFGKVMWACGNCGDLFCVTVE
jgi:hypothetical protein